MRRLLQVVTVVVICALVALWALSRTEVGAQTPYSDILGDVKEAGKDIERSFNEFVDESGIRDGAADLLEKGAGLLRGEEGAPEQDMPEQGLPEQGPPESGTNQEWV